MAYTLVPTELIVDGAITSAKLDTNIAISGTLGVTGEVTLATHLIMGDNDKIKIGTGGDLEIYHDGSNSYISNSTGNIYLGDTNGSVHIQAKLNEESIICAADGAVSLYYDNAVKLATTSTGIDVTSNDSTNNSVSTLLKLSHTTTGTAADGIGTRINFESEDDGGTVSTMGYIDTLFTDVSDGAEKSAIQFYTRSGGSIARQMHIASNGVAIGSTNNGVGGTIDLSVGSTSSSGGITLWSPTSGTHSLGFGDGYTGTDRYRGYVEYAHNGDSMRFATAATERMRIDSSGNVGIGNSNPSAFNSLGATDKLVIGDSTDSNLTLFGTTYGSLAFADSDTSSSTAQYAGLIQYYHTNNSMQFYTSSTERMRIDSSGTLLVGTTTGSGAGLEISKIHGVRSTVTNNVSALFDRLSSDGDIALFRKDGSTVGSIGTVASRLFIGNDDTFLTFQGASDRIYPASSSGGTRDAAIDLGLDGGRFKDLYLSGQALVQSGATTAPSFAFVNDPDTGMSRPTSDAINFCTAGSERMRIESSGDIRFGCTSAQLTAGEVFSFNNGQRGNTLALNTVGGASFYSIDMWNNAGGSCNQILFRSGGSATTVGSITSTGNNATQYNTSSDYRLKENVAPIQNGLTRLQQLNPVQFDWKNSGETSEGFIAHEVQEIFSDAVTGEKDAEEMQGMDYGRITPLLVKAIQEQQTIIDDLKSRIETLEG